MQDENPIRRGFFDTDVPRAPLSAPAAAAIPNMAPPEAPPASVAPIGLFAPNATKRKEIKVKRAVKPAELSTWVVMAPAFAFMVLVAPSNPAFAALIFGTLLLVTGLYTLGLGRPSWARLTSRRAALGPLIVSIGLLVGSGFLPSTLATVPVFLTAAPVASPEQSAAVVTGLNAIDGRFAAGWDSTRIVEMTDKICANDFASQTPERALSFIQRTVIFSAEPALTPEQARAVQGLVRSTYCGEPGSREDAVKSALVYSVPGMWATVQKLLPAS